MLEMDDEDEESQDPPPPSHSAEATQGGADSDEDEAEDGQTTYQEMVASSQLEEGQEIAIRRTEALDPDEDITDLVEASAEEAEAEAEAIAEAEPDEENDFDPDAVVNEAAAEAQVRIADDAGCLKLRLAVMNGRPLKHLFWWTTQAFSPVSDFPAIFRGGLDKSRFPGASEPT